MIKAVFKCVFLTTSFSILYLQLAAQPEISNDIKVIEVVSPISNFNYAESDVVDFVIRIRNNGPHDLIGGDQFNLTYSLANPDTTIAFDTNLTIGEPMDVGRTLRFTIQDDISFNDGNNFSACALVNGTNIFPINTNKFPGECSSFIVGLENRELPLQKVFYQDGMIQFSLGQPLKLQAEVFDMTGRLLLNRSISAGQNRSIKFQPTAKGIYFLKLSDEDGRTAIKKFIVPRLNQ